MHGVDYDARVGIGGVYVLYELKAAAAVELEVGDDGICRLGGEHAEGLVGRLCLDNMAIGHGRREQGVYAGQHYGVVVEYQESEHVRVYVRCVIV